MKILQINASVNVGSTGRIAEELGQRFINEKHQSTIAYGRNLFQSTSELIRVGNKWSVFWHGLQTRLFDNHGFASKYPTKKAIRKIEKFDPDLIVLHNIHGYYIHIKLLFDYIKASRVPVIWILYDCWAFTGHCSYFDNANCNKWKNQCYSCPLKSDYPKSILKDNSRQNYMNKKDAFTGVENMTIVAHSNWLAGLIKESFLGIYPVRMIHNGIDIDRFNPENTGDVSIDGIHSDDFIILGLANIWSKRKGFDDFMKLSELIHKKMKIVLVGLDSKRQRDLPENMIGISRTNNLQQLVNLYARSQVFVNPTWQDNFPTVNLEALACGIPVITYNTGGSPEAVDEKTGYVVEKGDIGGVWSAIQLIKKNGKSHYATECRERAEQLFNKSERHDDYQSLYDYLLDL